MTHCSYSYIYMSIFNKLFTDKKANPNRNRFLILDMGGGFLKGGILEIEKKEVYSGKILGFMKERREAFLGDIREEFAYEELKDNLQRLFSSLRTFVDDDLPSKTIFCFDQPFSGIKRLLIKEYRQKPKNRIDVAELKNIFQHAYDSAKATMNKNRMNTDFKIFDVHIQEILIDGYKVVNPVGFEGREIAFDIVISYLPQTNFEIVKKLCMDLNLEVSTVYNDIFCVFNSQARSERSNKDFLAIDFGSLITQLFLVRRGMFINSNYFNIGANSFVKKIKAEMNIGFSEAEEILDKYSVKKISEYAYKKIDKMMESEKILWQNGVIIALEEMEEFGNFPQSIMMVGGGSKMPFIMDSLKKSKNYLKMFEDKNPPDEIPLVGSSSMIESSPSMDSNPVYFNIFSCALRFVMNLNNNEIERNFKRAFKLKDIA